MSKTSCTKLKKSETFYLGDLRQIKNPEHSAKGNANPSCTILSVWSKPHLPVGSWQPQELRCPDPTRIFCRAIVARVRHACTHARRVRTVVTYASVVVGRRGRGASALEVRGAAVRWFTVIVGRGCRDSASRRFAVHILVAAALRDEAARAGIACRVATRLRWRAAQPGPGQQSLDGTRGRSSRRCAVLIGRDAGLGV